MNWKDVGVPMAALIFGAAGAIGGAAFTYATSTRDQYATSTRDQDIRMVEISL